MKCLNCNKETTNPKFCSRSCAATFTNKAKPKRLGKVRICQKCGDEFRTSREHQYRLKCPKCKRPKRIESLSTTLDEIRSRPHLKQLHRSSMHAVVRQHCRRYNADRPKVCQVCRYSLHIEFCHKRAIASFPDTATLGEVNSPDNVLILCRNHHWEFDNKYLSL